MPLPEKLSKSEMSYYVRFMNGDNMADSSYGSKAEAEALYDNFIAEKRDSGMGEPTAEAIREPSLEEDLDTLADQHRRLLSLMNEIQHTKQRIEEKNNVVGSRIGKLYEAIAMTNRGEYPVDKAQW